MAINLRDYSRTGAQRGWGAGWPSCGGAKAAGTAVVTAARSGTRFSVHKRIARLVSLLVDECERRGYLLKAGQTGGYNCRPIGGTSSPSNHSWGLAIDVNWQTNPMRRPLTTDIPAWMVELFNRYGFAWGGHYSGTPDAMHFEFMGTPDQADEMTALALRELSAPTAAPKEDVLTPEQFRTLRGDIGFARDQILTELGVDPATAPATRTAADRAGIAKARRADVGHAHQELTARVAELGAKLDDLLGRVSAVTDNPGQSALARAVDDLARRVLAIEARLPSPPKPGGS